MRIKLCLGLAVLVLAVPPVWATQQTFALCIKNSSGTRDQIMALKPGDLCTAPWKVVYTKVEHNDKKLGDIYSGVRRVIIVVHDANEIGSPMPSYTAIKDKLGGVDEGLYKETWLVAPDFRTTDADNYLQWKPAVAPTSVGERGYAVGDAATVRNDATVQVSSFDVIDHIVHRMKQSWASGTTEFIIAGFGSGAEFVNAYSLAARTEEVGSPVYVQGASIRYLMASAGRYTYMNNEVNANRYVVQTGHEKPPKKRDPIDEDCRIPGNESYYNRYPYGIYDGIPNGHYMKDIDLRTRGAAKQRLFLVGSADISTDLDNFLTTSHCPALQQGVNRRDRAFTYMHHLRLAYASENAGFCVVQGTGYHPDILKSYAARLYWRYGMVHCALDDPLDDPVPGIAPPATETSQSTQRKR